MVIAQREDGSYSPAKLYEEREYAVKRRDDAMATWNDQVARYMGPGFASDSNQVVDYSPHSSEYNYCSFAVPRLVSSNPFFTAESLLPGPAERQLKAHGPALNAWARRNDFEIFLQDGPATDLCFGPAAVLVSLEDDPTPLPVPDDPDDPLPKTRKRVEIERIDPRNDFFEDPRAKSPEKIKYRGHDWTEEIATLIERGEKHEEEGWNLKALREMQRLGTRRHDTVGETADISGPDRGEVKVSTFWVRDAKIDPKNTAEKGYHGVIFTLLTDGASSEVIGADQQHRRIDEEVSWLREPYDYWGPEDGPYESQSVVSIPNKAQGTGPLTMALGQTEHLYRVAQANEDAGLDWKRVYLGTSNLGNVAEKIMDAEHHTFISTELAAEDLRKLVVPIELGGLTEQGLAQEDRAKNLLEDTLGQDSAGLGNATGEATATEVGVADVARETRFSRVELKFRKLVLGIAKRVAWYHHNSSDVVQVVREQDSREPLLGDDGQPASSLVFRGGNDPEGDPVPFEALQLDIEEHTMNLTTSAQSLRKASEMDNMIALYAPLQKENPQVQWKDWMEMRGNLVNIPSVGRMTDYGLLKQIQALLLQMNVEALMQPAVQESAELAPSGVSRAHGAAASTGSGQRPMADKPGSAPTPQGFSSGREASLTATGR